MSDTILIAIIPLISGDYHEPCLPIMEDVVDTIRKAVHDLPSVVVRNGDPRHWRLALQSPIVRNGVDAAFLFAIPRDAAASE